MGIVSFCRHCGKPVNPNAVVCLNCGCPPATGRVFCGGCGNPVNPEQIVCLNCGVALNSVNIPAPANRARTIQDTGKSATTAVLLSCFFPGVGQMYLGQIAKGLTIFLGDCFLSAISFGLLSIPIWVIAMLDASKIGKRLENGEIVEEWQFF